MTDRFDSCTIHTADNKALEYVYVTLIGEEVRSNDGIRYHKVRD